MPRLTQSEKAWLEHQMHGRALTEKERAYQRHLERVRITREAERRPPLWARLFVGGM